MKLEKGKSKTLHHSSNYEQEIKAGRVHYVSSWKMVLASSKYFLPHCRALSPTISLINSRLYCETLSLPLLSPNLSHCWRLPYASIPIYASLIFQLTHFLVGLTVSQQPVCPMKAENVSHFFITVQQENG